MDGDEKMANLSTADSGHASYFQLALSLGAGFTAAGIVHEENIGLAMSFLIVCAVAIAASLLARPIWHCYQIIENKLSDSKRLQPVSAFFARKFPHSRSSGLMAVDIYFMMLLMMCVGFAVVILAMPFKVWLGEETWIELWNGFQWDAMILAIIGFHILYAGGVLLLLLSDALQNRAAQKKAMAGTFTLKPPGRGNVK